MWEKILALFKKQTVPSISLIEIQLKIWDRMHRAAIWELWKANGRGRLGKEIRTKVPPNCLQISHFLSSSRTRLESKTA